MLRDDTRYRVETEHHRPALTPAQVNPGDYSLIEPGRICGGRVVHYTERYQVRQARDHEQAAVQILPGAIPLDEIKPIDAGLFGRCSVCGLQAAAYNHMRYLLPERGLVVIVFGKDPGPLADEIHFPCEIIVDRAVHNPMQLKAKVNKMFRWDISSI